MCVFSLFAIVVAGFAASAWMFQGGRRRCAVASGATSMLLMWWLVFSWAPTLGHGHVPTEVQELSKVLETGVAYRRQSSTKDENHEFVVEVSEAIPHAYWRTLRLKEGTIPPEYFTIDHNEVTHEIVPPPKIEVELK